MFFSEGFSWSVHNLVNDFLLLIDQGLRRDKFELPIHIVRCKHHVTDQQERPLFGVSELLDALADAAHIFKFDKRIFRDLSRLSKFHI
jgi:hypothetical protein